MTKNLSIYLDLVRIVATFLVFVLHAEAFDGQWIANLLPNFGHDAVVVFFILSGFVIKYVAETKEGTIKHFLGARFIRIYSVVIPSLILTFGLYFIGWFIGLDGYKNFQEIDWLQIFPVSIFLLNQVQGFDLLVPYNLPFWSICYEVSYYALFSVAYYMKGNKRVVTFLLISFVIGPKVLLLFPLWLMGCVVYNIIKKDFNIVPSIGWFMFIGSLILYLIYRYYLINDYLYSLSISVLGNDLGHKYLSWSRFFVSDYIVGFLISLNFVGFSIIQKSFTIVFHKTEKIIRFLASITFSIYLMHFPLMTFLSEIYFNSTFIIISTLTIIFFVGIKIENSKGLYKKHLSL
mgnify:CR=1 FL=1